MSIPARLSLSLVSIVLIAAAIVGCSKKEDDPVILTAPSATAFAPVKATQDPLPPPPQPAAAGSAPTDSVAPPVTPPADAPRAAPASIESCCSALAAMAKDAKLDAVKKSKANAAAGMCTATAPLVKSGKAPRSAALSQIKATMAGSAPAACN